MNFLAIRTEAELRFDASVDASMKKWVNIAEAQLWQQGRWRFKRVAPIVFDVTAGAAKCPMTTNGVPITDFEDAIRVYDQLGNKLEGVPADVFDDRYQPYVAQSVTGTPEAFKVENGVIYLGPTPAASAKFSVPYYRKLSTLTAGGATQVGPMVADTDTPIWDANHHLILTWAGLKIGQRFESDLSYISVDDLYNDALAAMSEALEEDDGGMNREYGADTLGQESGSFAGNTWA